MWGQLDVRKEWWGVTSAIRSGKRDEEEENREQEEGRND